MYSFLSTYILPVLRTIWLSANKCTLSLIILDLLFFGSYKVVAFVSKQYCSAIWDPRYDTLLQVQNASRSIYQSDLVTQDPTFTISGFASTITGSTIQKFFRNIFNFSTCSNLATGTSMAIVLVGVIIAMTSISLSQEMNW
jgi:hypothetical protein